MNSTSKFSGRVAFSFCALATLVWPAIAAANTMTAFGVQYTSLGGASLSSNADGSIEVSNIGPGGSDGVSIALPAAIGSPSGPTSFALDTAVALGTLPTGAYLQQTAYGVASGGAAPVIATITETQQSGDVMSTADFSNSSAGPLTIDYYTGGPDGTLVHQEQTETSSCINYYLKIPDTMYDDWNYYNWPDVYTSGEDSDSAFGAITTPSGTVLPAGDDIDFIDIAALTSLPPADVPRESSVTLTGGGGLTSFAIMGDALAVPEPPSILLAASALAACGLACLRRRVALQS